MSNAPITVVDQNWRKRGSSRNTDVLIFVTMRGVFPPLCTLCLYVVYVICVCIVHIAGKAPLFCTHMICA